MRRKSWIIAPIATICCTAFAFDAARAADDAAPANESIVERAITAAERQHWAYQQIAHVNPPPSDDPRWNRHPIDRFIKAELDKDSIRPLPRAGKATLLRRLYFDLTGLPPTADEVLRFLADASPDAYERVVDRLLASPAYGERYAQHWLDLARFAETDGFEHDLLRPNAWRYRDWVIDALNSDVPFDEFLRLQLAGDEVHPGDPQAAIATGFLLCGPDMPDINRQDERRHLLLNEMTSTVGAVFLGMQIGCAQCHDHKFDPITIHDFYRLRAFFESGVVFREHPIPTGDEAAAHQAAVEAWTADDRRAEKRHRELEDLGRRRFRERNPDELPQLEQILNELQADELQEHGDLGNRIAALPKLPVLPRGRVFRQGVRQTGRVYLRGNFERPGPVVHAGFPSVLATSGDDHAAQELESSTTANRTALANWLTRPDHPLTARVIVNRLWQWHFGNGLSASPSDFGVMGNEPTHPELLDWLAREFVSGGWSFKRFHRLVVTSETFQLASVAFDHEWSQSELADARQTWSTAQQRDPENQAIWHRRRLRLEGEAIRDLLLAASGQLSDKRGGPGVRPPLPADVTNTLLKDQWQVTPDVHDHRRRSVYLFVRRNLRYPLFDVFDRPDTNASCPQRHESTTATQSLSLLNSQFSLDCARWMTDAISRPETNDRAGEIEQAYLRMFGRRPTAEEIRLALEFRERQEALLRKLAQGEQSAGVAVEVHRSSDEIRRRALVDLCLALFNANEAIYLD